MLIKVCRGLNVCIPVKFITGDGIRRWDLRDVLKSWEWSSHEWNCSWPLNHTEVRGASPPHSRTPPYNFWLYSWPFASADSTTVMENSISHPQLGIHSWECKDNGFPCMFGWISECETCGFKGPTVFIEKKKTELSGPEQSNPVFKVQL